MNRIATTLPRAGGLLLATLIAAGLPLTSQTRIDYLTPEEIDLVRRVEDPDRKIQLFIGFAADRLQKLENGIGKAGNNPEEHYDELAVRFDDYIRAVDDVAGHLEMWFDRGGVELPKLRKRMKKDGAKFLERLAVIGQSRALSETDLTYELEDSFEATRDMMALGAKIPDGLIPPQFGRTQSADALPTERQPGKPSLRRTGEDETGRKKDDKKPPLL